MPASYVHQSIAQHAVGKHFADPSENHALLAGAEGPDPLFFSFVSIPGTPNVPQIGTTLHKKKTDDFLLALCEACKGSALTRAYCCGFFTHYAADTTFHPFVYAHSLTESGQYSNTNHCTLEHQFETLHYRREGHPTGLPIQMAGFSLLTPDERNEIARAFSQALAAVFPECALSPARVRRAFDDCVKLCHFLRSEDGRRYKLFGSILSPFKLDGPAHAHMMPLDLPDKDIFNEQHAVWFSLWAPDEPRTESFEDLFALAVSRSKALTDAALSLMNGRLSPASLRSLHGGLSYDSGLPWQDTCPAQQAPGTLRLQKKP